jgi:LacI family transcriptional regulator, galactose operon repressor
MSLNASQDLKPAVGRNSMRFKQILLEELARGETFVGQFLPTIRELAEQHDVSRETVRRVLKMLEGEGLLASEPRHGYRVLRRSNQDRDLSPVAFVLSGSQSRGRFNEFYRLQLRSLQEAAEERGWSFLAVGTIERSIPEVRTLLASSSLSGIVLNSDEPELTRVAMEFGVPIVALETWNADLSGDKVEQDSFRGAFSAAEFLALRGHQRIAWLGPVANSAQSLQRWGGTAAALRRHGLSINEDAILDWPQCEDPRLVREFLSRSTRPTAIIAPWRQPAALAANAARELELTLGRDLDLVGWCASEQYDEFLAALPDQRPVPAVLWSISEMARTAIGLLAERIKSGDGKPLHTVVDARLSIPTEWPAFGA